MKKLTRVETDHINYYYEASEVDNRIAELTKDAEPLYQCMNVTDVNQLWRDISKETFDSLNKTGFQSTRILYTHPPAPKAITAEDVTDEIAFRFMGNEDAKQPEDKEFVRKVTNSYKFAIAAAVNVFNGVKP